MFRLVGFFFSPDSLPSTPESTPVREDVDNRLPSTHAESTVLPPMPLDLGFANVRISVCSFIRTECKRNSFKVVRSFIFARVRNLFSHLQKFCSCAKLVFPSSETALNVFNWFPSKAPVLHARHAMLHRQSAGLPKTQLAGCADVQHRPLQLQRSNAGAEATHLSSCVVRGCQRFYSFSP